MKIAPAHKPIGALVLGIALAAAAGAQPASPPQPQAIRGTTDAFGTTNDGYYRMASSEFSPLFGLDPYGDEYSNGSFRRLSQGGIGYYLASPHLPSGALLTYFELDACDLNASKNVTASLYDCDYHGECGDGPVRVLSSANNATPNSCSWVGSDVSPLAITVNNYGRQLTVLVVTEAGDTTTAFSGVILGYKLQVAPAPAVATFNDVPPADFGFQYIEALATSGITGGCGGGAYCPDSFVTRRQMAIFIAKALGLYLPHY